MTERNMYYCNGCHMRTPESGALPADWLVGVDLDGFTKVHYCPPCSEIRRRKLVEAVAEMHRATACDDCPECMRMAVEQKRTHGRPERLLGDGRL
jgi:hypothetical protein